MLAKIGEMAFHFAAPLPCKMAAEGALIARGLVTGLFEGAGRPPRAQMRLRSRDLALAHTGMRPDVAWATSDAGMGAALRLMLIVAGRIHVTRSAIPIDSR